MSQVGIPIIRRIREDELSELLGTVPWHLHEQDAPLPPQAELTKLWPEASAADPNLVYLVAEVAHRLGFRHAHAGDRAEPENAAAPGLTR